MTRYPASFKGCNQSLKKLKSSQNRQSMRLQSEKNLQKNTAEI